MAMKLIAKGSGMFVGGWSLVVSATSGDVVTAQTRVYTDAVAGTALTLGNVTQIGMGSNGVIQPGNVAVTNNGVYGETAGGGITLTGATTGYIADDRAVWAGGAMALSWTGVFGKGQILPPSTENAVPIGQTCLLTVSLANTVAARGQGSIAAWMVEL